MTYDEARKFIQEAAKAGSILGLENMRRLMQVLGDVQEQLAVIHIAGTNGKGSLGAYLKSILLKCGLHVGRYCSPAVFSPLEIWQIDDRDMSETEYAKVMSQVKDACDIVVSEYGIMPTVFEIETAAAFLYFAEKKPDVVLLETGMGGTTDATNIIKKPLCSVFTTISYDHMQFLGESLERIAEVKAGIIKEGCPVFAAPQAPEVESVIRRSAKDKHAAVTFVREADIQMISLKPGRLEFSYRGMPLRTAMAGTYQMVNASLAVETAYALLAKFDGNHHQTPIREGIEEARWAGRFEVLGNDPLFIIDGAHNEDAAKQLAKTIGKCFTNDPITYIIGVLADKEHKKMLQVMLPYASQVFCVTPDNSRALDAEALCAEARQFHDKVHACVSIKDAVRNAIAAGAPVLAFGSLSYLGELRRCFEKEKSD